MSGLILLLGIAFLATASFLPDGDARWGLGFVGVGFVLVSSLIRERAP